MAGSLMISHLKVKKKTSSWIKQGVYWAANHLKPAFLDMMISGLADADEQSDAASDPSYIPIFRRQVRLMLL